MSITYFVPDERKNGGSYQTVTGEVKRIDAVNGVIQMADRQCIPIADVFSIEIVRKNTILIPSSSLNLMTLADAVPLFIYSFETQ